MVASLPVTGSRHLGNLIAVRRSGFYESDDTLPCVAEAPMVLAS
jgi:hypothetical protein